MQSNQVIQALQLEPLTVEGGYFREIYRSKIASSTPDRCCGTSIYYLLRGMEKSTWHKVTGDEIWFYHAGIPAIQLLLFPDGSCEERVIGANLAAGQDPQSVIPAGTWQAAVLQKTEELSWGLFGATVFPGFEYADFTPGNGTELARLYPAAADRMAELNLL